MIVRTKPGEVLRKSEHHVIESSFQLDVLRKIEDIVQGDIVAIRDARTDWYKKVIAKGTA